MWSDETTELLGHDKLYIWRKKVEALKPQHHVVGLFYRRRDWCTSQNRWHHEKRKLCGYIEAASEGISQEIEAWAQMALPNDQWPKHSSKLFTKWLKYNKVKVLEWSQSQRPDLNLIENMWVALKGEWEQEGLQAWPRYTSSVKRTGPWCPSTTVESWWKDTWNIWPKWNSVGAILPNTKEVYVCFWL